MRNFEREKIKIENSQAIESQACHVTSHGPDGHGYRDGTVSPPATRILSRRGRFGNCSHSDREPAAAVGRPGRSVQVSRNLCRRAAKIIIILRLRHRRLRVALERRPLTGSESKGG